MKFTKLITKREKTAKNGEKSFRKSDRIVGVITNAQPFVKGWAFVVHHSKPKLNHCVRFRSFVFLV